jgi:Zn-dependent protease with chaperone function
LLWQSLGLASGLAAVGTLLGLALPDSTIGLVRSVLHIGTVVRTGGLFRVRDGFGAVGAMPMIVVGMRLACLAAGLVLLASLCWVLVAASAAAIQARRRQRALLTLLAHGDPKVPGALVVDYPTAAAYCLPGLRSQIVVSVGTLELLGRGELAALLAHERAHLLQRHDLVLLPFTALQRAFPRSVTCTDAYRAVTARCGPVRRANSCPHWCASAPRLRVRHPRVPWPPGRATWPRGWLACSSRYGHCPPSPS